MCGIVFVKRLDGLPASKMAQKRYRDQKERGQEGFGFVVLKGGVVSNFLKSDTEGPIINALLDQKESDEVLFHHRKPTSTPNFWETAHPIRVDLPKLKHVYYVAHNGVISNSEELKKEHDAEKIQYSTLLRQYWLSSENIVRPSETKWNDSESFAIELAKELDENVQIGLQGVNGTIAFVAIRVNRETKKAERLYWGRNYGNPLMVVKATDFITITSTGKGEEVKPHTLNWFDYETKEYGSKNFTVGITTYPNNYSGYDNHNGTANKPEVKSGENKDPIGFRPSTVPLIGERKPDGLPSKEFMEQELEEWLDAEAELKSIKDTIAKGGSDKESAEYMLARVEECESVIKKFTAKYPSRWPEIKSDESLDRQTRLD